jgi:hypothetical protein
VVEAFERAFKTGDGSHDLEVPDGESGRRFTIDVFPVRARGGGVELVGCMFADVSDRVARGRLSRELSAIVTSSDDAIMSKGLDGMIRRGMRRPSASTATRRRKPSAGASR